MECPFLGGMTKRDRKGHGESKMSIF